MPKEKIIGIIDGVRKARGQKPCELEIAVDASCENDENPIIIRTRDIGGVSPIVVKITPDKVLDLIKFLANSLQELERIELESMT